MSLTGYIPDDPEDLLPEEYFDEDAFDEAMASLEDEEPEESE